MNDGKAGQNSQASRHDRETTLHLNPPVGRHPRPLAGRAIWAASLKRRVGRASRSNAHHGMLPFRSMNLPHGRVLGYEKDHKMLQTAT
jgi:hypothetical protein